MSNGVNKLKSLKSLKTETVVKSVPESDLVVDKSKTVVVNKTIFGDEQFKNYCKILSDGKPHSIRDLLDHFTLPHTTSGREKLRSSNRKIGESKMGIVDRVKVEGSNGIHFVLVPLGK